MDETMVDMWEQTKVEPLVEMMDNWRVVVLVEKKVEMMVV